MKKSTFLFYLAFAAFFGLFLFYPIFHAIERAFLVQKDGRSVLTASFFSASSRTPCNGKAF